MELTKEEKQAIINQHIKNVLVNIFNLQMSIIQEESVSGNQSDLISELNSKISLETAKRDALVLELNSLNSEI